MVKTKEVNVKRVSVSSKRGATRPTHVLRGAWQNGSMNLSQYRLVMGCSLETQKK